jgi:hypothetical protein
MAAAKVLIERGARLDIRSLDGRTPFNYAAENLKVEMLQYLSHCAQEVSQILLSFFQGLIMIYVYVGIFGDDVQKMKSQTPRFFRGVSPQPQLGYSRVATPLVISGHEESTFNTNPATTRAGVSIYQDLNPLTSTPNGNSTIYNYSQNRMAVQNSQREVGFYTCNSVPAISGFGDIIFRLHPCFVLPQQSKYGLIASC